MNVRPRSGSIVAVLAVALVLPLAGQVQVSRDTAKARVIPGADYAASGARKFFLGNHYRDTWTTEIEVPYLDLETFAGGLVPISAHSGSQTTSLRMLGADGRRYQFRGVYKTPTNALIPEYQNTLIADLLQDGASASHPVGALVVDPLLDAVDILHPEPYLALMPDDPALGEFREAFKGLLGIIEERPNEADETGSGGFGEALNVIGPDRLFERIDRGPDDLVNARSFLTARMMDILIGDRDRHRDNWRWALMEDGGEPRIWEPISRDHDEAFVNLDGFFLGIVMEFYPQLVSFKPTYPRTLNLNWHAREVDRRYLVGLDATVWDSVATSIQERITDEVIASAVRELPPEMHAVGGAVLEAALISRRDLLLVETQKYYRMLAEVVEIHATNAAERAEIVRVDDRFVDVTLSSEGHDYLHRRFDAHETKEIRLDMWGGRDVVEVSGDGDASISLRVVGGRGRDRLTNLSTSGHVRFYDSGDNTEWEGARSSLNGKPFPAWVGSDLDRYPHREWGTWYRRMGWLSSGPDVGFMATAGLLGTDYGFRKRPYASDWGVMLSLATGSGWGAASFNGDFRRENSGLHVGLDASVSAIELMKFYGIGNDTEVSGSSSRFDLPLTRVHLQSTVEYELTEGFELEVGPWISESRTNEDEADFFASIADTLYGAGNFGQVGLSTRIEWDSRDIPRAATRGLYFEVEARAAPAVWDVEDAYAKVSAEARSYLTWNIPRLRPTLALRAGGVTSTGTLPFQEEAFVGGRTNLRGWGAERFAGDGSLYGSAEVRARLGEFKVVVPGDFGFFGLVDGARVSVDGQSPGGWHVGYGGGLWFAFVNPNRLLTFTLAGGEERTVFSFGLGFAY